VKRPGRIAVAPRNAAANAGQQESLARSGSAPRGCGVHDPGQAGEQAAEDERPPADARHVQTAEARDAAPTADEQQTAPSDVYS